MKYFVMIILIVMTQVGEASSNIMNIARQSLESNIVKLPQGDFLSAGAHQFGSEQVLRHFMVPFSNGVGE